MIIRFSRGRNEQRHPVPAREQSPSYDFGRPRRSSDLVLHGRALSALGRRHARSAASAKLPAKARARSDWRNRKGAEEPTLTSATRKWGAFFDKGASLKTSLASF